MNKAEFNVTANVTTIHSSLKFLPSCVNITFGELLARALRCFCSLMPPTRTGATSYVGTVTTDTPYPCTVDCLESVVSNVIYYKGASAEKTKCVVSPNEPDGVKVRCSFSLGAYGGSLPFSGMFLYAAHNVKTGELLTEQFDGNLASEGPSPLFVSSANLQTMPQGVVTLPKGTSGRYCFLFRLSCIEDDAAAKADVLAGRLGSAGATCVDIVPSAGGGTTATPMPTTTGSGGVTDSTIARTTAPRLYETVAIPSTKSDDDNNTYVLRQQFSLSFRQSRVNPARVCACVMRTGSATISTPNVAANHSRFASRSRAMARAAANATSTCKCRIKWTHKRINKKKKKKK